MTKKLKFNINCIPPKSTHQASAKILFSKKRNSYFVGKKDTSKGKETKDFLIALFNKYRPVNPFKEPIKLCVTWCYPWRKTEPKKNMIVGYKWCTTRPDCDNLSKLVQDIMTKLNFWEDDSQIAWLEFKKMWSNKPGIYVEIESLVQK